MTFLALLAAASLAQEVDLSEVESRRVAPPRAPAEQSSVVADAPAGLSAGGLDFGAGEAGVGRSAAPRPGETSFFSDGSELGFGSADEEGGEGTAVVAAPANHHGPRIDEKELIRHRLRPHGKESFVEQGEETRGLRRVRFSSNRFEKRQMENGVMVAGNGPMATARGGGPRPGAPNTVNGWPAVSPYAIGHTIKHADGSRQTLLSYDPKKNPQHPFHWKVTRPDGSTREYDSPLVFDLDGNGVRMSRRQQRFDADGDKKQEWVNDISAGDGLLVLDSDKDGISGESGLESFGTSTDLDGDHKKDGHADGFEALWSLARKAKRDGVLGADALSDGLLDGKELKSLEKAYGLKMRVGGIFKPAVSLEEAGVTTIALSKADSVRVANFDGQGNQTTRREGAVFTNKDGATLAYEDVWFEH